jgi:RNA polymerase sigma factor (sigma-70 family)
VLGRKKRNDLELIEAIKSGDRNALIQLYKDNFMSIRTYVINNSGTNDDAEDILQDATIVVWEKVKNSEFVLQSKLTTYVFAICKNLWLKRLNKNSRMSVLDDSFSENLTEDSQPFMNQNHQIVMKMMDTLGEKCRDILHLFYFESLDMASIAKQLNYNNADTVKAKKHQCFKQLQAEFLMQYKKSDFLGN